MNFKTDYFAFMSDFACAFSAETPTPSFSLPVHCLQGEIYWIPQKSYPGVSYAFRRQRLSMDTLERAMVSNMLDRL